MRQSEGAKNKKTGLSKLLRTNVHRKSIVSGESFIATAIHAGEPAAIDSVGSPAWTSTRARTGACLQKQQAASALVQVIERVQVGAACSKIRNGSDQALA